MLFNVLQSVVKPITVQPAFFLLLFVLLNVLDIYSIAILHSYIPLFKFFSGFSFCYILLVPTIVLCSIWQKIYKFLLSALAITVFVIDLYCLLLYGDTIYTLFPDAAAAVLATNLAEAQEFFTTYIDPVKCIIIVVTLLFIITAFYYIRKVLVKWNIVYVSVLFAILLFSLVFSLCRLNQILNSNIIQITTLEKSWIKMILQQLSS